MELLKEIFGLWTPYVIAYFGALVYVFLLFMLAKNKCDIAEKDFQYVKYCKMNWDNWLATLLVSPIVVLYMPDIVLLVNRVFHIDIPALDIYSLGAGVLVELLMFGLAKLIGWKETFIAPIHKD